METIFYIFIGIIGIFFIILFSVMFSIDMINTIIKNYNELKITRKDKKTWEK